MAYSETDEVRAMIKDDALNVLIGDEDIEDDAQREALIAGKIADAIADADGEIDGYLSKRYPIPLSPVPKVINKMSKDIAVYNLFSRIGIDETSREKNYLNRYNAAVKFLQLVASGGVSIGAAPGETSQAANSGFVMKSSPRLFSRDSMRGL